MIIILKIMESFLIKDIIKILNTKSFMINTKKIIKINVIKIFMMKSKFIKTLKYNI